MAEKSLQQYFEAYRKNIVGFDEEFVTPYGKHKMVYADWTASGRLYGPIEDRIKNDFGPYVGNTHTETTITGSAMTLAYHQALRIIKEHVNANENDVIFSSGSGMTRVVNKFQRLLGLRVHEDHRDCIDLCKKEKPVVFVTHMEHHSNHTTWLETLADVEVILPDKDGLIDFDHLQRLLERYADREKKYAAITAGSNVTGIIPNYYKVAEMMHDNGGLCFVDYACSGPYIKMDMHPENPKHKLDAIYFSPHKFLGGPGSTGIIIFDKSLYHVDIPDQPGGGTVLWTDPWGGHQYFKDIELREDGGTPAFLQTIRSALCVKLKEEMDSEKMLAREEQLLDILWPGLKEIPGLHILAENIKKRLGIISFYFADIHYNLVVKLLNDRFGIQVRSGCVCAGTYGHFLLNISPEVSKKITAKIDHSDLSEKPGWIRMSIHPTMTDEEAHFLVNAVKEVAQNYREWAKDYIYDKSTNEFTHKDGETLKDKLVSRWFGKSMK